MSTYTALAVIAAAALGGMVVTTAWWLFNRQVGLPAAIATVTANAAPTTTVPASNTPVPTSTPTPTVPPTSTPTPRPRPNPTLEDFWNGTAEWALEVADTGLPVGESDTIYRGNGEFWSYLHASTESAGIRDSCGDAVAFPGCVTRWVSTDGGEHFSLSEPTCLLECNSCPCDADDHPWQQQYPRVIESPGGGYTMVYEQGASTWITFSGDGLRWERARLITGTGIWYDGVRPCTDAMRIGLHPFAKHDRDCMAGGPPGLAIDEERLYVFVGLGQNPGHMGCFYTGLDDVTGFEPCATNPLLGGAPEYGPLDLLGAAANPYFDFRYITSADVIRSGSFFYMTYEGIRGPTSTKIERDTQFALGLARSARIDSPWEKFPGNPILGGVADNWGIGHADIVIVDGVTYLYTATADMARGRYRLVSR